MLGNHDLSLLAIGERREDEQRKVNPDLQRVLFADDRDALLGWLRMQNAAARRPRARLDDGARRPRAEVDHARWPKRTRARSKNACTATATASCSRTCTATSPTWSPKLAGIDRHRAIINVFTRLRYCTPRGRIAFEDKGAPGTQPPGLYPWYEVPGPRRARPEDRLRALVDAGPVHRPRRARHRHRRGLGRQAHRAAAGHRRTARGAGARPRRAGESAAATAAAPPAAAPGSRQRQALLAYDRQRSRRTRTRSACLASAGMRLACADSATRAASKRGKNASAPSTTVSTWVRCMRVASGRHSA